MNRTGVLSHKLFFFFCPVSGICVHWFVIDLLRLTSTPELEFLLNVMEISDPEVDPGDAKLCGCHTPLERSKRTDMSKTTNLLHKQEAPNRLGGK